MEVTEVKAVTLLSMGKMLPFMAVAVKEVLAAVAAVPVLAAMRITQMVDGLEAEVPVEMAPMVETVLAAVC